MNRLKENRHSRQFQLVQKIHEKFLNRWHRENIIELQVSIMWKKNTSSIAVDQPVFIKDNLALLKWELRRVLNLASGKNQQIRR